MIDVTGKWALITGASRGIGKLVATGMAEQGCNLVLHSRDTAHTQPLEAELAAHGIAVHSVAADLAQPASIRSMLDQIDAKAGPIDIVFNNAAVQIAYRQDYWKTPVEDFTASFQINTIAVAMICYHLMPGMIERGFGRVINTTSGIRDEPEQAGYSASKAALDKFTLDLGTTVEGTDVMINLTDPGWCRTDMGGEKAPNAPESAIPGAMVGAFVNDRRSGRNFHAQSFTGMSLNDAVAKAETFRRPD